MQCRILVYVTAIDRTTAELVRTIVPSRDRQAERTLTRRRGDRMDGKDTEQAERVSIIPVAARERIKYFAQLPVVSACLYM